MPTYRSPDVYVEEISVFPPSVAEVGTAIPAFIGYTEKATETAADDLHLKPRKIYSLAEYEHYFGLPVATDIKVEVKKDGDAFVVTKLTAPEASYSLYWAVKMYFDNGGSLAYVVSVGKYASPGAVDLAELTTGLTAVGLEDEPTLIVIPEAVKLTATDYGKLMQDVLKQCGTLRDRFAIIDLYEGDKASVLTDLSTARGRFSTSNLKYGAVYYPFVKTAFNNYVKLDESNVEVKNTSLSAQSTTQPDLGSLKTSETGQYNAVKAALKDYYITLPPSGAVAGVYAATDAARGVWKAPANVGLNGVVEPAVRLDNLKQDELNVDPTGGVSINALRAFAGKGTLVWGARTMAGNDNEWRYISVRRFFNTVEESIKKSTYWAVFEPNEANTWVKVRGMIEAYLTEKWRDGALAGATPKDAFFVKCSLGTTMNAQDILEGRMNVEVGMAVVRPAEFIVLKFSHKLQTS